MRSNDRFGLNCNKQMYRVVSLRIYTDARQWHNAVDTAVFKFI